ncbi:MAG TPA: formimidoylglutamate deiminase [Steroidobacteraceae bacterium]|nr:formimidoylglutamate deiminase [Steroidobacteraceae bacterium]
MKRYHLQSAFSSQGWVRDVLVTVSDDGIITEMISVAPADAGTGNPAAAPAAGGAGVAEVERVEGIVVPGMPNAHSHAFQRAMAGNTEYRLSARDSFWTWRNAMYALANRIEPDDLAVLATQLFVEMLKSGYTSVAEFHYLHRQRDGVPYVGANALWEAISHAASSAGIGLTLLPTLYQSSDFGGQALKAEQARFASDTDAFLLALEERISADRRRRSPTQRTGAAFHSLRAVPLENLRRAALGLRALDASLPMHIHVAEQLLEVQACLRATGRRPIELLLDTGLVTQHWCLVHATHATGEELKRLADSTATVCVSISTEANLGDGFFDTARFLKAGGRLCVGSDSQSGVNPAEELRWLEYQQRLRKRRRAVLATRAEPHVGTRLWRDAAQYGAQAIGQPVGAIAVGRRADWLVLDDRHPSLVAAAADTALDHLLFAGADAAIRDCMVAGRWVIRDRRHAAEDELRPRFAGLMRKLAQAP